MKKISIALVLLFNILFFSVPAADAASSQLIIINKKTNSLAFYDSGKLVRTFSVATGRSRDLTPEGTFRIVNKIVNRPYYTDNIPGGDPRNPLGNRWMGLEARGTYGTTYGIHGNNNENSIGKYVSSGCVRMHNEEVRWLFEQVQLYTPVIITYSASSFDGIAKANGFSVESNGWVQVSGHWYFYENGVPKTGWLADGGYWYYLDNNGVMSTGWVLDRGTWYYLDKSGAMKTGWVLDRGTWYYLEPGSGAMKTGWVSYQGSWYYLDNSGAMKTGWALDRGTWYYLANSGAMKTGWLLDRGTWYYLQLGSGAMQTGITDVAGTKYLLLDSGAMATNWTKYQNRWYYLNQSGAMAINTLVGGYKLGKDGAWTQYVALGDSLASGTTYDGKDDGPGTEFPGYPDYIAERFGKSTIDFKNFGVAGYTSAQLKDDVLNKPAVRQAIAEATHITVDIGANDLLGLLPKQPGEVLNPEQVQQGIAAVSANINTILSTIDQLNPKTNVYVMGYYNAFAYYPQEQQAQLLPLLQALNGEILKQAKANGDAYVATDAVIAGNVKEFMPNPKNIHLSLPGYQAVAGEFWKLMD